MSLQFDHIKRVVSLANLSAACEAVSGMCHRFSVEKVTPNRVHVTFTNPDEYGHNRPMTAVFPCYPCDDRDKEERAVVLDIVKVIGDSWQGEGWQAFHPLLDHSPLWRTGTEGEWKTYTYSILVDGLGEVYLGDDYHKASEVYKTFCHIASGGKVPSLAAAKVEWLANDKPYRDNQPLPQQ